MDMDFVSKQERPNESAATPAPAVSALAPTPVAKDTFKPESSATSKSALPYLAALTAFALLFLSVLYSVASLIIYVIEKWLVKPQEDAYGSYFDFSSFESYAVVFAISTLIITIPAVIVLVLKVRKLEADETWRSGQKWRRIIYTVFAVILITTLVSTLISTVFEVLSIQLKLSDLSYSYYDSSPKPDTDGQLKSAALSGVINALIVSLALVTIAFEYANKQRKVIWGTIATLALVGAATSIIGVGHINKAVADAKKKQESSNVLPSNSYDDTDINSSGLSSTSKSSGIQLDLDAVKVDLKYYANLNKSQYPTKAQWDDGSLKPKYLLSSDETLKKITYTPTGCTATGCSGYTLSAKDESGKVVEVKND